MHCNLCACSCAHTFKRLYSDFHLSHTHRFWVGDVALCARTPECVYACAYPVGRVPHEVCNSAPAAYHFAYHIVLQRTSHRPDVYEKCVHVRSHFSIVHVLRNIASRMICCNICTARNVVGMEHVSYVYTYHICSSSSTEICTNSQNKYAQPLY